MAHQFNPKKHHRRSIRLKGYDYAQPGAYFITICGYQKKHWFGEIKNDVMIPNAFGRIAANEWQSLPERFPQIIVKEHVIMPNHMHGLLIVGAPLAGALVEGNRENMVPSIDGIHCDETSIDGIHRDETFIDGIHCDETSIDGIHRDETFIDGIHRDETSINDVHPGETLDKNAPILVGYSPEGHPQGAPLQRTEHLGVMIGAYKSLVADNCLELFIKHRPGQFMGKLWQRNYWEHIIRHETAYHHIARYIVNNPKNWREDRFY
jgi:REP element-mobilizing transposase RayT